MQKWQKWQKCKGYPLTKFPKNHKNERSEKSEKLRTHFGSNRVHVLCGCVLLWLADGIAANEVQDVAPGIH